MRKIVCFSFLMAFTLISFSQSNFKPGLVVTLQGDTLGGYINYQNWQVNPARIEFRRQMGATPAGRYGRNDLQYFEITGEDSYVRAVIKKDMRSVRPEEVAREFQDSSITDTVFLRFLVKGAKLSLYQLVDFKEHYYLQEPGEIPQELVYKYIMRDESGLLEEQSFFRNQLLTHALQMEKASLRAKIEHASYHESDLSKIVIALNGEDKVAAMGVSGNKKAGIKPVFFGSIGVGYSSLTAKGAMQEILVRLNYKASVSPILSIGMDIRSRRNLSDLTLRVEVAYSRYSYTGERKSINQYLGYTQKETYAVEQQNITPSVSMLYNFRRAKKVKYYFGAGWGFNFASYPKNHYVYTNETSHTTMADTPNYLDFPTPWQSIFLRAGTRIGKNFELGVTGDVVATLTNYIGYSLSGKVYTLRGVYYF